MLPLPAGQADPILTGQAVTEFYNNLNQSFEDSVTASGNAITFNEKTTDYGFRFPVVGVAGSAEFDIEGLHGYRWREQVHNNQGSWQAGGYSSQNTTTLFGLRIDLERASPFFQPRANDPNVTYSIGGTAQDADSGDFDSDGTDDIAIFSGSSLQVRYNRGGNFANYSTFTLNANPLRVFGADLNGDGKRDILAVTSSGGTAYITSLIQTSYGLRQEGPSLAFSSSYTVYDAAVGDLSGDGLPDVAFVTGDRSAWWLNGYAGKNIDTWGADDFSVKLSTAQLSNRANSIVSAPANCSARAAAGNANNAVYVYWQSNLTLVATLSSHTGAVNSVSWSPDCSFLAAASTDKNVSIWRTSNWTLVTNLTSHTSAVQTVAFDPSGALLASGGADGFLKIWNVSGLPLAPTLDYNVSDANGTIYALAWSPDGSTIAAGTGNRTVRLRTTTDYSLTANLTGHTLSVKSLAYSPDGFLLLSGSDDDKMFVWATSNNTKLLERTVFGGNVNRIAFNTNGTRVITASDDGRARVWRASDWSILDDVVEGSNFVFGADFDRSGERILTGGNSNYVRLWDKNVLLSFQRYQTTQEFTVLGVAYSPSGLLASASEDGTVEILYPANGTIVKKVLLHGGTANAVAWNPNGTLLASAGSDGLVHVLNASTFAYVANLTISGNVTTLDFSPQGDLLAAGSAGSTITVWSALNWSQVTTWSAPAAVNSLAFDPWGTQLVSGAAETTVRIWNASTGESVQNITGPTQSVRSVDWSSDGLSVAAGGNDDRVRIWSASTWALVATLTSHTNDVTSVRFSPDSTKLASASLDRRIYTWNPTNGSLLQQYTTLPSGATSIWSIAWSPDAGRIAAGWADSRFPVSNSSGCSSNCGSSSSTGTGIAIGQADSTAGNDIILAGRYKSTWNAESWVSRLGFSSGAASSWSRITAGLNDIPDTYRVALGDLTGDGRPDLAAATDVSGSGTLYLLWWNTTSNSWESTPQSVPLGGAANEILIADVTDDGFNDVVVAVGSGANRVEVAFYEPSARTVGQFRIANVSKYDAPAVGASPTGIAIGRFNNDSLPDVAGANGPPQTMWLYLQKDELFGTYTSAPVTDAQLPGFPIVQAFLYWDDWVQAATGYNASVSIDGGFTWFPLGENVTIFFNGSNSTSLQYRFEFRSARAGMTAWITSIWVNYLLETTVSDPILDVGRDFVNDWTYSGRFLGIAHVSFPPEVVNQYVADNLQYRDANGTVYVPIRVKWQSPGALRFTNLSIAYNLWPAPPELKTPGPGSFADATPTFVLASQDTDADTLKYHIQLSGDPSFATGVKEYNQNITAIGWSRPFYLAGQDASFTVPDAERLSNGQKYFWRARSFDGLQWSLWSPVSNFTVDDLSPEGFARSPLYATVVTFAVTWAAVDPAGGSGLADFPYDVQYKDGIDGQWLDWHLGTSLEQDNFTGENGHTYYFRMRAVDRAGNQQLYITSPTGDTSTTVDTEQPTASIIDLAPFQQSKAFLVEWTGADNPGGSGILGYDVFVKPEDGSWSLWLPAYPDTFATYRAAKDQMYSFQVAARDRAGNLGSLSADAPTRVDTSPPSCSVRVPATTTTSLDSLSLTMSCTDLETGVVSYEYMVGTGPVQANLLPPVSTTSPVTRISDLNLTNGETYYLSVRGFNAAGSWSPWVASDGVRIIIPGPAAQLQYPSGVWINTNVSIALFASDTLGYPVVAGELQYRRATFRYGTQGPWDDWFTLPFEAGTSSFVFTDLVRGYVYQFQYRARNSVGSWGAFTMGDSLFVNQLPIASAGPDRIAKVGEDVILDATQSFDYDGDRDTLTYRWEFDDGRPAVEGPVQTVQFTTPGTHRQTLIVSDGYESSRATVTVFVPAPPPRQVAPGLEAGAVLALFAAAALVAGTRRRRGD